MAQQPAYLEETGIEPKQTIFVQQLAFIAAKRNQDEATVLAQAVQKGVHALYQEALIEAYLLGQVSRERLLQELGAEEVARVDYLRDALKHDVTWGAH
ncbi:MAG: hypothetical protein M1546_17825 [Chloroflexi bacterium]|nr:hypothetical protein [Chloroflexota bacterium]